jgi:nucleoside 2-deoxyribosyltransferase
MSLAVPLVFISHSGSDRAFAENIRDALGENNIITWINYYIGGGKEWRQKIDEALDKCQVVLVVASENSYNSPYVTYEIGYAMGQKKPVIALIYKNPYSKIHPRLRTVDYYDFRGKDWPFEGLLTDVHKLLKCNHAKVNTSKLKEDNNVFVSYTTSERDFGNAITRKLKKENISVQINILDKKQEDDWRREINGVLDSCKVVLVIVSADSQNSLYVTYEFAYAMGQKKRVIPLICDSADDKIHPRLTTLQRYDFRDTGNWPKKELLSDVKSLLGA